MLKLKKKNFDIDFPSGDEAVMDYLTKNYSEVKLDNLTLVCDTKKNIVFLTDEELKTAFSKIEEEYKMEFYEIYSKNRDVSACIENGLLGDIAIGSLKAMDIKINKYFDSYENKMVHFLINEYNQESKK